MGWRSGLYIGNRTNGTPLLPRKLSPAASWMGALSKKTTQLFGCWVHGLPGTKTPNFGMRFCTNRRQSAAVSAPLPTTTDWKPRMPPSLDTAIVVLVRGTVRGSRRSRRERSCARALPKQRKTSPRSVCVSSADTIQRRGMYTRVAACVSRRGAEDSSNSRNTTLRVKPSLWGGGRRCSLKSVGRWTRRLDGCASFLSWFSAGAAARGCSLEPTWRLPTAASCRTRNCPRADCAAPRPSTPTRGPGSTASSG